VKKTLAILGSALLLALPLSSFATPQQDLEAFQDYYKERFPNTPFEDFVNGVYSIDAASRATS
jgi:sulfur-oxidizing protein SoxA